MKTLIILTAFLLALSSCTKELPVPCPDPDPVYTPDPDPDPYYDPDPDPDPSPDPGDDDPPPSCYNNHPGSTITWMTATSFNSVA